MGLHLHLFLAIFSFFTVTDNTPPVGRLMMMCEACIVRFCVYIYDVYFI